MTLDLQQLHRHNRLLFSIPLAPLQGARFQPTGFPGLGAATYQTATGSSLLVESAQSMANRLESTIWDAATNDVIPEVRGVSHVRVTRKDGRFLTDTIVEAHRLNSPYLLAQKGKEFINELKESLKGLEVGPVDRLQLARVLLEYDVGSLLHGVFLAKPDLAGGRLRIARAISAFIEADGARVAASGGVKNDHVNPRGDTKSGFGNVPFARDEYTAEKITLYANLDLAQIRGYGLDAAAGRLLLLLAMFKLRCLADGTMRLRTACDLAVVPGAIRATNVDGFELPHREALASAVGSAIADTTSMMRVRTSIYADEIKPAKEKAKAKNSDEDHDADDDDDADA
jgi:CRISPR-associated protein Csb1